MITIELIALITEKKKMTYSVQGKTAEWEIVVGLEVHTHIKTKAKLFSSSSTEFGCEPNTNISYVDCAMPGQLPVLNGFTIYQAVKTGLGISGTINKVSVFDRKNYFYADLPQGYQITQLFHPLVEHGYIDIDLAEGEKKRIRINRIHVEQDAGKLMHDQDPKYSFVDLNRSGIGLMEIVSEPDIAAPEEAIDYIKKLRSLLRTLDTSDADMERGNFRCDVNVSVRKRGATELGTRCEIKNLNSTKSIIKAIDYEAHRQVELLENGGVVEQETRLFNPVEEITKTMRSKEDAIDYRYFPDPDLPPLVITDEFIEGIRAQMPELPEVKKARYMQDYHLNNDDAELLVNDAMAAKYFETLVAKHDSKLVITWLTVELFGRLNKLNCSLEDCAVSPNNLLQLLDLIKDNVISGKIAKDVLDIMVDTGEMAAKIVEAKGLKQVTDTAEIEAMIDQVLQANADKLAEYRQGKDKLFGFFVGQVMKAAAGKANPQLLNELLAKKLKG